MMMLITSFAISSPNTAELLQAIDRLDTTAKVLYVAAHPDDENTELLSWLVNEKHVRAAYLSMTRGEGGQNLLGAERAPLLGVIRTQELRAARRVDGAEQFFGRERDFGFSKSPEETLRIWGKDQALFDAVWVIRKFQPDVIITRFSPEHAKTHGHHTASAIIAKEAFSAAADPNVFPEQKLAPWQAKRIVWNKGAFGGAKPDASFTALEIGAYNPVLGVSMGEIAAKSRSMHKSQGFGDAPDYGARTEYFKVLGGAAMHGSPFDDVDFSWRRIRGSEKLQAALTALRAEFAPDHPEKSLRRLFEVRGLLSALPEQTPMIAEKRAEVEHLLSAVAGIVVQATVSSPVAVPGHDVDVSLYAIQRTLPSLMLKEVRIGQQNFAANKTLGEATLTEKFALPKDTQLSQPYWLREPEGSGTFTVNDDSVRGLPEAPPLQAAFVFTSPEGEFTVQTPLQYRWLDPVAGERQRPLEILSDVSVNADAPVVMFPDAHAKTLRFSLHANVDAEGVLAPTPPPGFSLAPAQQSYKLKAGEDALLAFTLTPPEKLSQPDDSVAGTLSLNAHGLVRIDYPHIPVQTLTPLVRVRLVRFSEKRAVTKIGYVPGAGDDVPQALRDVGYNVTMLDDAALEKNLSAFEAIVIGVRAFNVNPKMLQYAKHLNDYVQHGGVVVVQYNTQNRISAVHGDMGPYPLTLGQDRVTEENAEVTTRDNPVLRSPNAITPRDFDGWVQERGLYFAEKWDGHYETPLSMHDAGEDDKRGSLLIAHFGKGKFVYTGLSFFRQLPEGVPGAYRLFANLLSVNRSSEN